MLPELHWWAILAAAALRYVSGAVWYGLLGETWLRAIGKRREDLNPRDPKPYLVAAAGALLIATTLGCIVAWSGAATLADGLLLGAGLAVGLPLAAGATHYAFNGSSPRLFAIDYGWDFLTVTVMTGLLAAWKP